MAKKILLAWLLFMISSGLIFADSPDDENNFPKNTISFDGGLLVQNLFLMGMLNIVDYDSKAAAFGAAVQYERQMTRNFSLLGRLEYKYLGISTLDMSVFSIGGYARFYPTGRVFFLDGNLGYSVFHMENKDAVMPLSHYFRYGLRLGWRIDFGRPGGFIMEPSLGYNGVIGYTRAWFDPDESSGNSFRDSLNFLAYGMYDIFVRQFFVGGLAFNICFGYRF